MSQHWRSNGKEYPCGLVAVFMDDAFPREEKVNAFASLFVHQAYIFNAIAYFKGEHAKDKPEPQQWQDGLRAIDCTNRPRLHVGQLLKSLCCIEYNTDVKGWLTDEQYNSWARKTQYEKFHNTLQKLIHFLAFHLLDFDSEDYKNAKWQ